MGVVLVTGGTGFIGSHTVVELIESKREVLIVDSFVNSKPAVLGQIQKITGIKPQFIKADLTDKEITEKIFQENKIDSVIHFAGLKAVGESVSIPLRYYQNNLISTLNVLDAMQSKGVRKFVFSSSATVYGDPASVPIREDFPLSATNPYGRTKLMIEEMLSDIAKANPEMRISVLRYFNPIGAHESGHIGEDPQGIPNNLVPYVARVAAGILPRVNVFGNDYKTHDGTGVRDYIHVVDLARAHLAALERLDVTDTAIERFNIGTGKGYSVLDVIKAYEKAAGVKIPYVFTPRRSGDIDACYADPQRAKEVLHWEAKYDLDRMCRDSVRFLKMYPKGIPDDN